MATTVTRADATEALATDTVMASFVAILRPRLGQHVWPDRIRDELTAAGIEGQAIGASFQRAYDRGYLHPTEETRRSTNPSARGRRVAVWLVQHVPEQRKAA